MGEVKVKESKNGGKPAVKKLSTRVDMTPVVDLAFLLLTFFMLATTFIKPQVMELILPEKTTGDASQPKVNEKKVLSVVLAGDNRIYWYAGMTAAVAHESDYSSTGIRKVLQEQNEAIENMVVLVKPNNDSTYVNLVDMLDELTITNISRYALVDFTPDDERIIAPLDNPGAVIQPSEGQQS